MFAAVVLLIAVAMLVTLVALGWVPNSTQPGRKFYPAGPDLTSKD